MRHDPRTGAMRGAAARKRRRKLLRALGGKCYARGCRITRRLEFDHIRRRTWVAREKSRWQRMVLYEREAAKGWIRVACRHHNARRGKPR